MSDEKETETKIDKSVNVSVLGCLPFVLGVILALLACAHWGKLSNATARWLDGQCNCKCK